MSKDKITLAGPEQNRVTVQFDLNYSGTPGKQMDPNSKTQPNATLSIKQMVQGHRKTEGGDIVVRKPLEYVTEIPMVQDLNDLEQVKDNLENQIKNIQNTLNMQKAEAEAKEAGKQAMMRRIEQIANDQNVQQKPE